MSHWIMNVILRCVGKQPKRIRCRRVVETWRDRFEPQRPQFHWQPDFRQSNQNRQVSGWVLKRSRNGSLDLLVFSYRFVQKSQNDPLCSIFIWIKTIRVRTRFMYSESAGFVATSHCTVILFPCLRDVARLGWFWLKIEHGLCCSAEKSTKADCSDRIRLKLALSR